MEKESLLISRVKVFMLPFQIALDVVATNLHTILLIDNILIFFLCGFMFSNHLHKKHNLYAWYFRSSRGDINWKIAHLYIKTTKYLPVHCK